MKRKISTQDNLMSQFEQNALSNLSAIVGGTGDAGGGYTTSTIMYDTKSSASDTDSGDHDSDY